MKYTVTWKPSARARLTELWMESPHRNAISASADAFDRRAKTDPHDLGEERNSPTRIAVIEPLVFLFDVHEFDCRVDVLAVKALP